MRRAHKSQVEHSVTEEEVPGADILHYDMSAALTTDTVRLVSILGSPELSLPHRRHATYHITHGTQGGGQYITSHISYREVFPS